MKLAEKRFEKVNRLMEENNLDALMIPPGPQTTYVTDSIYAMSIVIILKGGGLDDASIVLNRLPGKEEYKYVNSQKLFSPWIRYVKSGLQHIPRIIKEFNREKGTIGVVRLQSQPLSFLDFLKRELPSGKFVDATDGYERLRMIKDSEEISRLMKGAEIADLTLIKLRSLVKPGVDEYDVLAEAGKFARLNGTDVGSLMIGANPVFYFASSPYPGILRSPIKGKTLTKGETNMVELCSSHRSYWTRIGRTINLGGSSDDERKTLDAVSQARNVALEAMAPGVQLSTIAKSIYETLNREKLSEHIRHGLGGGIGLEIQEIPPISIEERTKLKENMVLNLRIGVYKPNHGGAFVADNLLITNKGARLLSKTPIIL